MLRLKTLKVKGIRGIVDGPDLHIKNGGLILCGDNGTGKSSYVDAIEKVLTDRCSSLDDSGRGVSWRKQGSHISCVDSEIELTLVDGSKEVTVTLDTDLSILEDTQARNFLEAAHQQSFVLRRRTLLDFINATPSKRYQAIEHFLNLDKYKNFEDQLKDLSKDIAAKIAAKKSSREQHERTLRESLKLSRTEVISEATCIATVNNTLQIANAELITSLADIPTRKAIIENQLASFGNMEILQKFKALADLIETIPDVQQLREVANKYLAARKEFIAEETRLKGHFYSQVLETGLTWITQDQLARCPLCDSPINIDDVQKHVETSIAKHERFIQLKQKQSSHHTHFLDELGRYRIRDIKRQWREVIGTELSDQVNAVFDCFERLLRLHQNMLSVSEIESGILQLPESNAVFQGLQNQVELKLAGLPDNTRYTQLYNAKSHLVVISIHLEQITSIDAQIDHLVMCHKQLEVLALLAEKCRKEAVQKLLNAIVDIANRYFQKIHPGEEIGEPNLEVPERGSGSIELMSQFHTETGDPRGHYSEGHVDSLGLCLFLAIRRIHHAQRPELALLVLDDVMHSVDANHRRDTANLIFEEFSDHQIIITTHDPLWFEYLKIASRKSKGKFTQRRIANWTLETGPIWGDHLSNYEWLISEEGIVAKPSDLVIKAGVLLEEMLQNLCNNLSISIPFRIRGDYTIGPLWENFYLAASKYEDFHSLTKECLDEIDDLRNLRNWVGAHWNEWAQTLTKNEAMAFTDAVLQLRSYTYCDECGQFIKRIPELDGVWSCEGECKRYNKKKRKVVTPSNTQLLTWQDLTAMGVPKGPYIGRFISMIREEQTAGNITTREEAEAFVRTQLGDVS